VTVSEPSRRRVVVIDDDTDIVESIAIVLEGAGYDAEASSNGKEALDRVRAERPCLILLDLMMPGMNGWQFRAEQLQDATISSIPVVVMTGFPAAAENAKSLGASACLKKPIDLDDLLDTVARYC
jgi:CheY-like chemotaxis protein